MVLPGGGNGKGWRQNWEKRRRENGKGKKRMVGGRTSGRGKAKSFQTTSKELASNFKSYRGVSREGKKKKKSNLEGVS